MYAEDHVETTTQWIFFLAEFLYHYKKEIKTGARREHIHHNYHYNVPYTTLYNI